MYCHWRLGSRRFRSLQIFLFEKPHRELHFNIAESAGGFHCVICILYATPREVFQTILIEPDLVDSKCCGADTPDETHCSRSPGKPRMSLVSISDYDFIRGPIAQVNLRSKLLRDLAGRL